MALRYLHAFGFSAAVHRCCCEAKNPVPRLQCDTRELNSACTCRTSATERPETSSNFDGRSINANHGPIRASVGLQLYLVMRGGVRRWVCISDRPWPSKTPATMFALSTSSATYLGCFIWGSPCGNQFRFQRFETYH